MINKNVGSVTVLLAVSLIVAGFVLLAGGRDVSASGLVIAGDSKGIRIEPSDRPLFTMNNMAPGDSQSAPLTVSNDGDAAFTCTVSAVKEGGADILFDGLLIAAAEADGTELYSGPLSGLNKTAMGKVTAGRSKGYIFTITFPKETANAAQGKTLSMKFVFTATGSSDGEHHHSDDGGGDKYSKQDEVLEIEEPEEVFPDLPEETGAPYGEEPVETFPDVPAVPEGELPKTGEFPPGVIHAAGLALILAGLILLRRQVAR